jgi:hypothetical protein
VSSATVTVALQWPPTGRALAPGGPTGTRRQKRRPRWDRDGIDATGHTGTVTSNSAAVGDGPAGFGQPESPGRRCRGGAWPLPVGPGPLSEC